MSAPCASMCVAKQWRSTWGETASAAIPAAAARSRSSLKIPIRVNGRPRRVTKRCPSAAFPFVNVSRAEER